MVDLRVINILPQQPVSTVAQPQVASNKSSPPVPANIAVGSILSGFIINRDNAGNPILRSESGDITFASNFFLKIGSEVTIRIENTGGNIAAKLLTVNGQPPEIATLQSGLGQDPEVIVSKNLQQQPAAGAATGQVANNPPAAPAITITGTLITPAHSNTPEQLPATGSQIALKVVTITPAATQPLPTQIASAPINIATTPYAAYGRNPTPTATPQASNTPAPTIANAIASTTPIQTPAAPAANIPTNTTAPTSPQPATPNNVATPTVVQPPNTITAPPPKIGATITATVLSNEPTGEAIVQTPLGIVRLQAGTQLPVGSVVTFELKNISDPQEQSILAANVAGAIAANITTPAPITQLARTWVGLQNIFTLLAGQGSADALNFLNNTLPNVGERSSTSSTSQAQPATQNLAASLLGFASAVRSGDFRNWLGRANARWLEQNGHGDVLKKAESEFLSIAQQYTEAKAGQWQSLFFPISVGGELQQARLFVKRDKKDKEENGKRKKEDDTRFVVEIDLTQLGQMQMDGFVRKRENAINFDLVIRSHTALSKEAQQDILRIYNDTGELTGYKGSIIFQAIKEFPVNPMEEISTQHMRDVMA